MLGNMLIVSKKVEKEYEFGIDGAVIKINNNDIAKKLEL